MDTNTRSLREMRTIVAEATVTPYERKAIEGGLKLVEKYWEGRHREQYDQAMTVRMDQYERVAGSAIRHVREAGDLLAGVENGRVSPKEARTWLRDAVATHSRLLQQHQAIVDTEDEYAALEAMTPDQYQEDQMNRFHSTRNTAPSLQSAINDFMSEV